MVPRAAHGVADHETFGERAAVVRAVAPTANTSVAAAHQQHLLVADMAEQLAAVGELSERDARVRSGPLGFLLSCAIVFSGGSFAPDGAAPSPRPIERRAIPAAACRGARKCCP